MKVVIEIDEVYITPLIQRHLSTGKPVQEYVVAGCRILNYLFDCVDKDYCFGIVPNKHIDNAKSYNNFKPSDISSFLLQK